MTPADVRAPMEPMARLEAVVGALGGVAVGLSGGVDSSLLCAVAARVLGDRAVAVVARSPSLPSRELAQALVVADGLGIEVEVVDTEEVADPRYAGNPRNRCAFCKEHQLAAIRAVADRRGLPHIAHGETLDDRHEDRPGRGAARRAGARAPLADAGLSKDAVRRLARALGLVVWDKPAQACLASRIPHGQAVTMEKLAQVEQAEQRLADLGLRAFRVRHHGDLARLEVAPEDMAGVVDAPETVVQALRAVGFAHVTLDLAGLHPSRRALPLVEGGVA